MYQNTHIPSYSFIPKLAPVLAPVGLSTQDDHLRIHIPGTVLAAPRTLCGAALRGTALGASSAGARPKLLVAAVAVPPRELQVFAR